MRIGIITDIHANLPALSAALDALKADGCDHLIHTGDAIGIGPHPREVMTLLQEQEHISFIIGNHDALFAFGIPDPLPAWISVGEAFHQEWTHGQLDDSWRVWVREWPRSIDRMYELTAVRFQHYALDGEKFHAVAKANLPHELDSIFRPSTDMVFFGHHHSQADVQGLARYINPGALGCHPRLGARYALLDVDDGREPTVTLKSVPYDADMVREDMIRRKVPEAGFILQTFLR